MILFASFCYFFQVFVSFSSFGCLKGVVGLIRRDDLWRPAACFVVRCSAASLLYAKLLCTCFPRTAGAQYYVLEIFFRLFRRVGSLVYFLVGVIDSVAAHCLASHRTFCT